MSVPGTPSFYIGDLPIHGEAILSPMDGFSDLPFRAMARRLGSAMSYSEFINAIDVMQGHPSVQQKIAYTAAERPMVFQLFDDDPARLLEAALRLRQYDPDIIDVNMGCSAKTVAGRGAGAGLLRQPAKVAQIFSALSRALDIPVTGKMRLGWDDDSLNYLEIARIVQDNGGQLLAVHGRTKKQAYGGEANWEAIAEVKAALRIPVIGNGDVCTVADIARMRRFTGCDAVMIGRGAIGNPWIFAGLDRQQVSPQQVRATMLAHLESMLDFYGAERGLVLFRKHASRYISPFRLSTEQRQLLLTSQTADDFTRLVDEFAGEPVLA